MGERKTRDRFSEGGSPERGNDATRRWKKQRGRERWPTGDGRGKRGRKEARKCGGVDSTVLRGFRAAASLPRASLARNSANATRPSFLPSFLPCFYTIIFHAGSLGFFSPNSLSRPYRSRFVPRISTPQAPQADAYIRNLLFCSFACSVTFFKIDTIFRSPFFNIDEKL